MIYYTPDIPWYQLTRISQMDFYCPQVIIMIKWVHRKRVTSMAVLITQTVNKYMWCWLAFVVSLFYSLVGFGKINHGPRKNINNDSKSYHVTSHITKWYIQSPPVNKIGEMVDWCTHSLNWIVMVANPTKTA